MRNFNVIRKAALLMWLMILPGSVLLHAQAKYLAKSGHVWFAASTPLETVEAHNHQATSYIDSNTGDIACQLLMKSFKFDKALMEEHFNENYVESDKFPKGEFKGKISNLSEINFKKDGIYKAVADGSLTIHGVTKQMKIEGTIEVKDNDLVVKAQTTITPEEFNIAIPAIVKDKIAKTIDINVDMTYNPYEKK